MMHRRICLTGLFLAGIIVGAVSASGAEDLTGGPDPKVKAEIQYAEALQKLGLPDYMKIVLDRLISEHPEAKPLIKILNLQSLISVGKFEEVLQIIAKERDQNSQDAWAMRLALADGYYAWSKFSDAQAIYVSFFKAFSKPTPALNDFYINSAYKYAQMLLVLGDEEGAVAAYENVLKADVPKHIMRQVMSETAELLLKVAETKKPAERKAYFDKIDKLTTDLLWIQDIWFGKAIVIMAQERAMQGNIDGAQKLVNDYTATLKQIHETLVEQNLESLSPMANCRYLLGSIMWDEAQKLIASGGDKAAIIDLLAGKAKAGGGGREPGALSHFLNVFIGYPSTKWAADAGEQADKIETILRGYGAKINTSVTPEKMAEVRRYQFQGARALFSQNQFANAVEAYLKVLNRFPEGDTSVAALGELARSYIETDDDLMVDTTVRYMAERFGGSDPLQGKAGDQVLRAAGTYGDRGNEERKAEVYEVYFDHFKEHPMAAALLYQFGTRKFSEERYQEARAYYERIVNDYPTSPSFLSALKQITYCQLKEGDTKAEILALKPYIAALEKERKPGTEYIRSKFRMAAAFQKLDPKYLPTAIKGYSEIIKLLETKDPKYAPDAGDDEKNAEVIQGCLFFKAVGYTQIKEPAAKLNAYRGAAIKTLQTLVSTYPKSRYAPSALSQIGTLWTVLENADEAQKALKQLQTDYPGTPEAENSLFVLGTNLLDLGMRSRAVDIFRQMFSGQGKYSNTQILTAGNELLKAGEYDISLQAFDRVIASTSERVYVEKALMGRGQVMVERKEYDKAATVLQEMLDTYPNSGMTVEASLQLTRCYSELATREPDSNARMEIFNKAIAAMTTARKYDKSVGFKARSDVEIGRLLALKAQAETQYGTPAQVADYRGKAMASFQGLMMLGYPGVKEARPHIEDAFSLCLPLLLEAELWQDALDDCDRYIEIFGNNGRYVSDVRRIRSKAKTKLAVSGATAQGPVEDDEGEAPAEADLPDDGVVPED
ncbi:MAG: tetratricopeptide repeat protein [Lentisphaerae bacterium]|nr:tetratricopeptide repeat protein [Lentisphaerota bacterium]